MILDWKFLGEIYIRYSSLICVKHMSERIEKKNHEKISYKAP